MSLTTKFKSAYMQAAVFSIAIFGLWFAVGVGNVNAQSFSEDFATVPPTGWAVQNNSQPLGTRGWFQGDTTVFPAQSGATNSYIAANFDNTGSIGTISNWLFPPSRTFRNGDVVTFYTRTVTTPSYPERLQVRLSTAGSGTNVGATATSVGDFTTLLLDINPTYTVSGYPVTWTQFSITLAGLPAGGVVGRLAFRYFVENGGLNGGNSDYIGIDTFVYTSSVPTAASVTISGRVLSSAEGRGLPRAIIHLTDQNGNIRMARTNPFGYYRFTDVEVGQTLIVNVFHKYYQFDPQVISLNEAMENLNFTPQNSVIKQQ